MMNASHRIKGKNELAIQGNSRLFLTTRRAPSPACSNEDDHASSTTLASWRSISILPPCSSMTMTFCKLTRASFGLFSEFRVYDAGGKGRESINRQNGS